jgi:hypothetical protein
MLERGGELRAFHLPPAKRGARNIAKLVSANVKDGSVLLTDEARAYAHLDGRFHHFTVNHKTGEYVRDGFIHTNSLEGAWSLLKRQIYGIHHFVSPKHLGRYVSEMTWRYNRREMEDGSRVDALIAGSDGRLTYKALIG